MKCSDARHLVHLEAGNDLVAEEQTALATHLAECSPCNTYRHAMAPSTQALLALRHSMPASPVPPSVWPAISKAIQQRTSVSSMARKFNLQVAALSVCSLALAAVTIVQTLSAMRAASHSADNLPTLAQPVRFAPQPTGPGRSKTPAVVQPFPGDPQQNFTSPLMLNAEAF
jgi:predicted anti-sigma-YlaC factor YlaD